MEAPLTQLKETYAYFRRSEKRALFNQVLNLGLLVTSALMAWKSLIFVTGSESPIVVVLSGSMEPGIYRGDILFLTRFDDDFQVGDIVVYKIKGRDVPIVHRVLEVHVPPADVLQRTKLRLAAGKKVRETDEVRLLTKGDNNRVDDRGLYNRGQNWLSPDEIVGKTRLYLPNGGMLTIWLNEYPALKVAVIGGMCLLVIMSKEQQ